MFDFIDKLVKILAVVIAGLWVYFNSIRGRTYVPRLKLALDVEFKTANEKPCVLVTMRAINIGTSIAKVKSEGTGLYISGVDLVDPDVLKKVSERYKRSIFREGKDQKVPEEPDNQDKQNISDGKDKQKDPPVFPVFKLDKDEPEQFKHIEPSSEMYEQKIILYPRGESHAIRFELRVRVEHYKRKWSDGWFHKEENDRIFRAIAVVPVDSVVNRETGDQNKSKERKYAGKF